MEVERHLTELHDLLGVWPTRPVEVFIYPSAEEKGRLLGAGHTLIARPWTNEIHVQGSALPISALRHELAHVVVGEICGGVFRVPMAWWVIPRVMLIEGMATALEEDGGELTLMQKAAVMKRMGKLPPLDWLVSLWGFFWEGGPRAYTAAGSFLRFVAQTHGYPALARIYREGSVEGSGLSLRQLEAEWHAHLDALPVPEERTATTRRAMNRGSVLERRCVDQVTDLWKEAHQDAAAGRLDEAESAWRTVLRLDEDDDAPLRALLEAAANAGDVNRMQRVADELLDRSLDGPARAQVLAELAAAHARAGDLELAMAGYDQALTTAESDAQRRSLRVARFALSVLQEQGSRSHCGQGSLGVLRFMLGQDSRRARGRTDLMALLEALGKVPVEPEACLGKARTLRGLLGYLMGRQMVEADPHGAEIALREALFFGLPDPLLEKAALVQRAEAQEAMMHFAIAHGLYQQALDRAVLPGERAQLEALFRRTGFAARVQDEEWVASER